MHILAARIETDIVTQGFSAVYDSELCRVWPMNGCKREKKIILFAEEHGWRLRNYKDGFVAIFDKDPSAV
jgi:hypothetical protein